MIFKHQYSIQGLPGNAKEIRQAEFGHIGKSFQVWAKLWLSYFYLSIIILKLMF
jgi:hypothetical protein